MGQHAKHDYLHDYEELNVKSIQFHAVSLHLRYQIINLSRTEYILCIFISNEATKDVWPYAIISRIYEQGICSSLQLNSLSKCIQSKTFITKITISIKGAQQRKMNI